MLLLVEAQRHCCQVHSMQFWRLGCPGHMLVKFAVYDTLVCKGLYVVPIHHMGTAVSDVPDSALLSEVVPT